MRDSSRGRDYHALYQGPTLVGPQAAEKELGFKPLRLLSNQLLHSTRTHKQRWIVLAESRSRTIRSRACGKLTALAVVACPDFLVGMPFLLLLSNPDGLSPIETEQKKEKGPALVRL